MLKQAVWTARQTSKQSKQRSACGTKKVRPDFAAACLVDLMLPFLLLRLNAS
jgi:hypothetical protein